jgi:5-(carboxyamino)imidazole ribonucleotide synthase
LDPLHRCVPGSTIGILGGGQLGRMLSMAAAQLGLRTLVYDPQRHGPGFDVATEHMTGRYDDEERLAEFAARVSVVTYEFENVPAETASFLAARRPVRPGPRALAVSQDRLAEKAFFREHGCPVGPFAPVESPDDIRAAIADLGLPAVLKTRRLGYDGKGQAVLRQPDDVDAAWAAIGARSNTTVSAILEAFVPFTTEISVLIARDLDGATAVYDVTENVHREGILRQSSVPAGVTLPVMEVAQGVARSIAGALDYVGVLGVEFFVVGDRVLVNEIAPRVHNSGHWTVDACACSQFENHIRAVAGWPLGPATRHSDATMTNLIGDDWLNWPEILAERGACLHLYGKGQARPGRKMGHVIRLT